MSVCGGIRHNAAEEMKTAGLVAEKALLIATAAPAPVLSTAPAAEVRDTIPAANATKQASNTGPARTAAAPDGLMTEPAYGR